MSDQPDSTKVPSPEISDTIIKDAVNRSVAEATAKLREEFATLPKGATPEDVERAVQLERQRISDSISGKSKEPSVDPLVKNFVTNPSAFVEAIIEETMKETNKILEERDQKSVKAQAYEGEVKDAFYEVVASRSDIVNNEACKQVWTSCYYQTDPNKPEKERMREATVKFDKMTDEMGVDRSKISQVATPSGGAGSLPNANPTAANISFEESIRQDQKERHAAYERSMGRGD